jgi:hypothetical protein
MLSRIWFSPAVPILIGRDRVNVNSVQRAAEILMSDEWPTHGVMCERAAQALIDALNGSGSVEEARDAFRDAAEEAGVLVR